MDKELENILKKANKDDAPEEKPKPKKVYPPSNPYDYLVFTKLVPVSGFNKTFIFFVFPAALCVGFFFKGYSFHTIMSLAIYFGLVLIYTIINFIRFQSFKGWEERLPFQLKGWRDMIRAKKMFCDLCWNDVRLTIEHEGNDDEIKKLLEASLKLFCKKTEMAFYNEDFSLRSKKGRKSWNIIAYNTAEGSANPEVMRYMKQLFEKELRLIAEKTGKIRSVKTELLSDEFEIKIRIDGGD